MHALRRRLAGRVLRRARLRQRPSKAQGVGGAQAVPFSRAVLLGGCSLDEGLALPRLFRGVSTPARRTQLTCEGGIMVRSVRSLALLLVAISSAWEHAATTV